MKRMKIHNPFDAPVFHEEAVSSTMDVSRKLADDGCVHGTVICADYQENGRGRIPERQWLTEKMKSLPFTILLRYGQIENIPPAITLRTGLAAIKAIGDFVLLMRGEKDKDAEKREPLKLSVKWPNDIIIAGKKAGGILTEADGGNVHIGIGLNISQKTFPFFLAEKAASIAVSAAVDIKPDDRFLLLEKILLRLFDELEVKHPSQPEENNWKQRLEKRLFKKGEQVIFINGAAGSENTIRGTLTGISETGELLIIPEGEATPRAFITGELKY